MSANEEFGRGVGGGVGGGGRGRNIGGRHQNVPYRSSNDGGGGGDGNGRNGRFHNNNNNINYNNSRNQQRGRFGGRFENNNNNNSNNSNYNQQQQPSFGGGRYMNRHNNNNGRGRGRNNNNNNNNNRRNFTSRRDNSSDIDIIEQIGCIPNVDNSSNTISIAIEGCCHGELDRIYERIYKHEQETNQTIDLLLCCGDFQSIRCIEDFHTIAIPSKYRTIGTFYQYYNQQKPVPILTIFIGGNHEVSQSLSELQYGGWVAPNIYYLGHSGVISYRGIRIGGISGIYKSNDYTRIRTEIPPYNPSSIRSIYHVRNLDVYRLKCLQHNNITNNSNSNNDVTDDSQQQHSTSNNNKKITIMVSHDWPLGIDQYGNTEELIRKKPFFKQEIYNNTLGSIPNRELLNILQPSYWFAGHLHVKFHATIIHNTNNTNTTNTNNPTSPKMKEKDVSFLVPSQVVGSAGSTKLTNTSDNKSTTTVLTHEEDKNDDVNDTSTKMEPTSITNSVPVQSDVDAPVLSNDQQEHTLVADDAAVALSLTTTTQFIAVETATPQTCTADNNNNNVDDLTSQMTKFLSLDKCLPRRQYLSIVHIPCPQSTSSLSSIVSVSTTNVDNSASPNNDSTISSIDVDSSATTKPQQQQQTKHKLQYDPEWLAILRKTHTMQPRPTNNYNNNNQRIDLINVPFVSVSDDEIQDIINRFDGNLEIPENFQQTVPGYKSNTSSSTETGIASSTFAPNQQLPPPLPQMGNPQTDELLQKLHLDHILTIPWNINQLPNYYKNDNNATFGEKNSNPPFHDNVNYSLVVDDNEIDLDNIDDFDETKNNIIDKNVVQSVNTINNNDENEIDIDNIEEQHDENEIDINSVQTDEINTDDQHHHDLCIETNKKPRLNT